MSEKTFVVYLGGGFIHGVPTRDMTRAEWEELPESWRRMALETGLYRLAPPEQPESEA
jgi:hypothetical protein